VALASAVLPGPLFSQRAPVLQQVKVPHPYYFREMFHRSADEWAELSGLVTGRQRAGVLDAGLAHGANGSAPLIGIAKPRSRAPWKHCERLGRSSSGAQALDPGLRSRV
jgi:hypothetical protein